MSPTILLVEDETKLRELVRSYLEHEGIGEAFGRACRRLARAAEMGRGSPDVQYLVSLVVNRENLDSLAALLESGDVKVVIDKLYPLSEAAAGSPTCWGTMPEGRSSSPCGVGVRDRFGHQGVASPVTRFDEIGRDLGLSRKCSPSASTR